MRRSLALLAAATTSMVAIAFLVPLAILVQTIAAEHALSAAEMEARSLAPVVASVQDEHQLDRIVAPAADNQIGALTVYLPDGSTLGHVAPVDSSVELARAGRSFSAPAPGGVAVLVPVVVPGSGNAVVRVMVPSSRLREGVTETWVALAAIGVGMVAFAVVVADRIARGIVTPTRLLAGAAQRLAQGELQARVEPHGPPEVADLGRAFNVLGERIQDLLAAEREGAADLSHRLRTPLTALRLDLERQVDGASRDLLTAHVDALERGVNAVIHDLRRHNREGVRAQSDLGEVTRERVRFWAALAEDQGRPFSVDIPPGVRPVAVHRSDLEAALDALLGNVFAHTPEHTAFAVRVEQRGAVMRLVVEDEGPGISLPLLARGVSTGSTGLGLDIARRVAEASRGRMTIGPREGGGTRVELDFGLGASE